MDKREKLCTQRLDDLRRAANGAERRLLTAQGNDLTEEVRAALEEIGFKVTNVDQEIATRGDLLEDLRVEDPHTPNWISLVEVRGYAAGAKVNDLQRIGRFVERYIFLESRRPSARWYIVNHYLNQDPTRRPRPLASNAQDVKIFADSGGLVIDTRSLFASRNAIRSGSSQPESVRQSFREATGIYGKS